MGGMTPSHQSLLDSQPLRQGDLSEKLASAVDLDQSQWEPCAPCAPIRIIDRDQDRPLVQGGVSWVNVDLKGYKLGIGSVAHGSTQSGILLSVLLIDLACHSAKSRS